MRTLFHCLALLVLPLAIMLLAGCGGDKGWTLRIQNAAGVPVAGARVCVWPFALDPKNAEEDAQKMGKAWEQGELPMRGYLFTSDKQGKVQCKGMPTGKMVVDGVTPGYYRTDYDPFGVIIYHHRRYGYRHGHDEVILGPMERTEYIPPRYHQHWEPGDWLTVTVTAPGFRPYHFAFRPDAPNGDLGTVQLLAQ